MSEKLEEKLIGICPNCEKESTFEYIGEQENVHNKPPIQFYDCKSCGSSIDLVSIYDKNPRLRVSSQ